MPGVNVVMLLSALAAGAGHVGGAVGGPGPAAGGRNPGPLDAACWRTEAVCYGPHRDGQQPGGPTPTAGEIEEDLRLLVPRWHLLRTYGAAGFPATLLATIRADSLPMKVMLGVWITAGDSVANHHEIEAAIALASTYPDIVVAVCVGNETQVTWSPTPCPLDELIACVRQVRSMVAVPVTSADDFSYWVQPRSRVLAAELDFVTMHAHPLWNGQQLDQAIAWLAARTQLVQAAHPDLPVVIGETGWATAVAGTGEQARLIKGRVSEADQATFMAELRSWTAAHQQTVFVFEAFDENWKGSADPDDVEKHWGLFHADRTPKLATASAP